MSDVVLPDITLKADRGKYDPADLLKNRSQLLDNFTRVVRAARAGNVPTLAPFLPLLLNLEDKPYSLVDHFPFEALFATWMPPKIALVTGRQVSKSTSVAAQGILLSAGIRRFKTLYMTPLFEQIRRFSSNYVQDMIMQSPVQGMLINSAASKSVLQRSFANGSIMHFSYALLSADRTRGIKADRVSYDESLYLHTPLTLTKNGRVFQRPLVDVRPGDTVLSFTNEGRLTWRPVLANSYHGKRHCFRLVTKNGRDLVGTAESWVATDHGWRRISQIIEGRVGDPPPAGGRVPLGPTHLVTRVYSSDARAAEEGRLHRLIAAGAPVAAVRLLVYPDTPPYAYRWERADFPYPGPCAPPTTTAAAVPSRAGTSELAAVEYAGEHDVYDIEVEGTHTFVANGVCVSNCQDFDRSLLPIVDEVMSHSDWALRSYTGTPKTRDNTLENLWQRSSMAEWFTKCNACSQYNIASVEWHLLKMIGPYRDDISRDRPGTVCAFCSRMIDPRHGFWVHKYPERRTTFAGYHVPQVIMPIHYTRPNLRLLVTV